MTAKEFLEEYARIAHGIQTGIKVKYQHQYPILNDTTIDALKHVRVGIDTAKADLGSVGRLLIKKGVFTEQEYFEAMLEGLEDELLSYTKEVQDLLGKHISLA